MSPSQPRAASAGQAGLPFAHQPVAIGFATGNNLFSAHRCFEKPPTPDLRQCAQSAIDVFASNPRPTSPGSKPSICLTKRAQSQKSDESGPNGSVIGIVGDTTVPPTRQRRAPLGKALEKGRGPRSISRDPRPGSGNSFLRDPMHTHSTASRSPRRSGRSPKFLSVRFRPRGTATRSHDCPLP